MGSTPMGDGKERADTVSADDIKVREVPRRQFLRGIGLLVPASALALGGCIITVSDVKERADSDVNVTTTDVDPFDPPNRVVRPADPVPLNDSD